VITGGSGDDKGLIKIFDSFVGRFRRKFMRVSRSGGRWVLHLEDWERGSEREKWGEWRETNQAENASFDETGHSQGADKVR